MDLAETLTKEQRTGAVVVQSDKQAWVVWRHRKKLAAHIALADFRKIVDEWGDVDTMSFPVDTMLALATKLADIEAGTPAPPIDDPKHAALEIGGGTTYRAKWVMPFDKRFVLALFQYVYDGRPSIQLRYFERKNLELFGYQIMDERCAFEIATHIRAMCR